MAVAIENAALYREVQRKEELRGELLKKVISAQEDERKRIARELHDETSQALVALMVALERALVESSEDNHKKRMEDMKKLVVNTLEGVHHLIYDLRPSVLDDLGLQSAIRWYGESHLEPLGINFSFEVSGREVRLPGQMEIVLFLVVQEAATTGKIRKASGLGLLGMEERVSLLEGSFQIVSNHGQGTKIAIKVPYLSEEATSG